MSERPPSPDGVDAALATIRAFCGWHVAPVRDTPLITIEATPGSCFQLLPTRRLLDLQQVLVDGEDVTKDVSWLESGTIQLPRPLSKRLDSLQVRMRHGYAWDEVPDITAMLGRIVSRGQVPFSPYRSQSAGPYSYTQHTVGGEPLGGVSLLIAEKAQLAHYRLEWGP